MKKDNHKAIVLLCAMVVLCTALNTSALKQHLFNDEMVAGDVSKDAAKKSLDVMRAQIY